MWQCLEMVLTVTPVGEGCSDIWWVEASLRNLTFSAPRSNLHNIRISILRVFEEETLDIFEYIQWWKAPCFTRPPILLLGSSTGNRFLVLGWNLFSGAGAMNGFLSLHGEFTECSLVIPGSSHLYPSLVPWLTSVGTSLPNVRVNLRAANTTSNSSVSQPVASTAHLAIENANLYNDQPRRSWYHCWQRASRRYTSCIRGAMHCPLYFVGHL